MKKYRIFTRKDRKTYYAINIELQYAMRQLIC